MNYKRALGIGVLIYFVTMVIGMIVCAALGLKPDIGAPIPMSMWITSAFLAVVLSVVGAYWYFQGKNLHPSMNAGLRFGGAVLVVGFLIDILFFLSLSFDGYDPLAVMMGYYSQPPFWTTIILILLGSGLMGQWLEKNKKHHA